MTDGLRLAPGLIVPVDGASESWAVLGQRGSGKSNVAVCFAEELWDAGVPWVAIDPKGDWWGIRSSGDGQGPGLPVVVFGGLHGDLPLLADSGEYIADLIVDENLTAVLDVSDFTGGEMARFLTAFCHRLFRRHQRDPHVRFVIYEEAHRYIPQSVTGPIAALKEATAKIPLEGRAFGLGSLAASQRSSRLHKDVLTQITTLIAMRSPAKLDRDAIGGWTAEHGVSAELLASLPSLEDGEGWVWSPYYLKLAERFQFRRRRTFDSGATPKVGERRTAQPRTMADIDLAAIEAAMPRAAERARLDDPAFLRGRIKTLEARITELEAAAPSRDVVPHYVAEAVWTVGDAVRDAAAAVAKAVDEFSAVAGPVACIKSDAPLPARQDGAKTRQDGAPSRAKDALSRTKGASIPREHAESARKPAARPEKARENVTPARENATDDGKLGKPERAVLSALAPYAPAPRSRRNIGLLADLRPTGTHLRNTLSALRQRGLVDGAADAITITPSGLKALGRYEPLPDDPAVLLEHWCRKTGKAGEAVLRALYAAAPERLDRDGLADATGYEARGTHLRNTISHLKGLDLIDGTAATGWALADDLQPDA